jgi:glycosyltransferase involved in cell wall biosynthesis
MDELKSSARRLGVDRNVRFLGYVSDEDLLKLYKISDIVCIPSHYEPFGIVALEGMAANVPVVVSDVGGLRDFVEHMETGITTYAGDAGSLAWGLLEIFRNPDLAEKLRKTAFSRVQNIYNWNSIAEKTYDVYRKVIENAKIKAGKDGNVLAGSRLDA